MIRTLINEMFNSDRTINRKAAYAELNGVSSYASILAVKRGLNTEMAAIIGLLHNYYFYKTNVRYFPGINSAEAVRPIIRDLNIFSHDEPLMILRAVFYQNQSDTVHGPYDQY